MALVLMTLIDAAVLPPERLAHAEPLLGSAIAVGTDPFAVAADPVNNRIYVAQSGSISVIDGRTNQRLDPPIAVPSGVNGIAVNPSTQRIYVSNPGNTVTVIDAATRLPIGAAITVGPNPTGLVVDPTVNRIYVAVFGTNSVRVIDGGNPANGGSGDTIGDPIPVGAPPIHVALNPSLKRVYATLFGGNVRVIDSSGGGIAGEGAPLGNPIDTGSAPVDVAVDPVSHRVYVTNSGGGTVRVINGLVGGVAGEGVVVGDAITVGGSPTGVAVNSTSKRVYVTDPTTNTVTVINAASSGNNGAGAIADAPLGLGTGAQPQGLAVNPSSGFVYLANQGPDTVAVLGIPHLQQAVIGAPAQLGDFPIGVAVNPNTNRVYVTHLGQPGDPGNDSVSVLDGTTLQPLSGSPITVGDVPTAVAVDPTANRVYVVSLNSRTLSAIDGATNQLIGTPVGVGLNVRTLAVNPNPSLNRVYAPSPGADTSDGANDTVLVVDGATLQPVDGSPVTVGPNPGGVAVNPNTGRVYVASVGIPTDPGNDIVSVIDGPTNQVTGSPITVGNLPGGVAVNPNTGRVYVASAGNLTSEITGAVWTIGEAPLGVVGSPIPGVKIPGGVDVNTATNLVYVIDITTGAVFLIDAGAGENGGTGAIIGAPIAMGQGTGFIAVNSHTGRAYVPAPVDGTVAVVGPTFGVTVNGASVSKVLPGTTVQVAWDKLFGTSGNDRIGLFAAGAANGSAVSQVFTNGTAAGGGTGVAQGIVNLPVPAALAPGTYQVRLVSGHTTRTMGALTLRVLGTPTATNDSYSIAAGSTLTVPVGSGVLANDTDGDNLATLQAHVVSQPASGTLNLQPNGAFTYTPAADVTGAVTFTYKAIDADGRESNTATATIALTGERPAATDDGPYPVNTGASLSVPAAMGVLANDTDADTPSSGLRVEVVTRPTRGTLDLRPDGSFTYTPQGSASGTDTFTYRVTDANGLESPTPATATFAITAVACGPRPSVTVQSSVVNGELQVAVGANDVGALTQNRLREIRFGTLQNAQVTLNGQAIVNDQVVTLPADAVEQAFTVRRATLGQPTTVPFTVVDTCGSWPTFVGGGPNAGF